MPPMTALSPQDRLFILGLGATGRSVARAALGAGATVTAWDDEPNARRRASEIPGLRLRRNDSELTNVTHLIWSPGIALQGARAHPLAARAAALGLKPVSDVELFLRARPGTPVAAVTGTDGKSTTVTLLAQFLQADGCKVSACGNLGPPVLDAVSNDDEIVVLEMSSYQLLLTPSLAAEVAVLVSLAPDHLDWHGSLAAYLEAKRMIFQRSQRAVIGVDDDLGRSEYERLRASHDAAVLVPVSGRTLPKGGVGVRQGCLYDAQQGKIAAFPSQGPLMAPHNRLNAAAAWAAAALLGVRHGVTEPVLREFQGLPHRFAFVAEADGVRFINDSKATTVHATKAALASRAHFFWIAGGQGKGQDFTPLFCPLPESVHAVFCIGEAAESLCRLAAKYQESSMAECHDSLASAFDAACAAAHGFAHRSGETATVLLSPACASFDQFENFVERGRAFTGLARAWAAFKEKKKAAGR